MINPRPTLPPLLEQARHYHHGHLAEALITATVEVIAETGLEKLSIREVAKRLGVSPAAPFRHYASKTALLTAVAEKASQGLRKAMWSKITHDGTQDPIAALIAVSRAYLHWAFANPTYFNVISSRAFIDFGESELLMRNNADLQKLMIGLLNEAQAQKILRADVSTDHVLLGIWAMNYGLARLATDGHMQEWRLPETVDMALDRAMTTYFSQLRIA